MHSQALLDPLVMDEVHLDIDRRRVGQDCCSEPVSAVTPLEELAAAIHDNSDFAMTSPQLSLAKVSIAPDRLNQAQPHFKVPFDLCDGIEALLLSFLSQFNTAKG